MPSFLFALYFFSPPQLQLWKPYYCYWINYSFFEKSAKDMHSFFENILSSKFAFAFLSIAFLPWLRTLDPHLVFCWPASFDITCNTRGKLLFDQLCVVGMRFKGLTGKIHKQKQTNLAFGLTPKWFSFYKVPFEYSIEGERIVILRFIDNIWMIDFFLNCFHLL